MNSKDLLRWLAFAGTYFLLQAIPTSLYGDHPALRGANAVAMCLLLLQPRRHWPQLAALLWTAAAAARIVAGAPHPWLLASCNALEVLAVAAVLHGRHGLQSPWYGRAQLPRLVLAAGVLPLVTGASAAMTNVGIGSFGAQWMAWYLASMLAYVTLAPLVLGWSQEALRDRGSERPRAWRVGGIVCLTITCIAMLRQELYPPLLLLTFPLLVLSAWWYRLAGVTTVIAFVAVAGGWFADRDIGALFVFIGPEAPLAERIHALQLYLGAAVLCSLPFAVLLAEQHALWVELQRKSDARAEFLAAMSHEIRTPMTGVLGMADMLATQPLSAEQRRYVDAMRASGRHLVSVVNDILDFSRIETGKLTLEHIDFRLAEVIEQVRSLVHPAAREKGLELVVHLQPDLPQVVRGDPTRLRQILLNLASNAVKFTAQGSVRIDIGGTPTADGAVRARFEVRDTGIGIAPHQLKLLFTPFTQAHASTARQYGGSGLGLAISTRLAETMGGSIHARSAEGEGSVFALEVPLQRGDPALRPASGTDALGLPSPQRILVAEDVEINRDILRLALGRHGHRLSFAHDGAAALALVQQEDFDLVLMDVQMPVMDGTEATRRIRALPGARGRIPIIGLTANVMSQEQALYLQAGMDECLTKPIEWDRLAAAIARHGADAAPASETAQPAASATATTPDETPLLDTRQFEAVRGMTDSEAEFRQLLQTCLVSIDRTIAEIQAAGESRALGAASHKLKGSASMLGLARVSALAARLERSCARGDDDADRLRERLIDAVRETRALLAGGELEARGV